MGSLRRGVGSEHIRVRGRVGSDLGNFMSRFRPMSWCFTMLLAPDLSLAAEFSRICG